MARMSSNELYNLGHDTLRAGYFADCEQVMGYVVARKRMNQALTNLAYCQYAQGPDHWGKAIGNYDQAISLAPEALKPRLGRAMVFHGMSRGEALATELAWLRTHYPEKTGLFLAEINRGQLSEDCTMCNIDALTYGKLPTHEQGPTGIMGD